MSRGGWRDLVHEGRYCTLESNLEIENGWVAEESPLTNITISCNNEVTHPVTLVLPPAAQSASSKHLKLPPPTPI